MLTRTLLLTALALAIQLVTSRAACAQAAADGASQPPGHKMTATWQDGLVLASDDGAYEVHLGAFIRFDGRFASPSLEPMGSNTFLMRTVRANFQGRLAKYFTFRLVPDFAGAGPTIADAWIDVELSKALHLRFGRDKVPVGWEVLLQDSNVLFLERGLTLNLMPQRDIGIQAHGDVAGGLVSYSGGVFNGQVDGASNNSNLADTDNAKDLAGRVVVRPFGRRNMKALELLTVGVGGTEGQERHAPLPVFKTSVQQTYFTFASDAAAAGSRSRLVPQASYFVGPLGVYAEEARTRQRISRGATSADIENRSWQVVGAVLLTGETAGERVRPRRAFDPEQHHWGALQLTARVGHLSVDSEAFSLGFADPASSRDVQVATVGTNWYLTTNVKMQFNVERSVFDHHGAESRPTERAALIRMQLNY